MNREVKVNKVTKQPDLDQVFAIRHKVFVEEQNCPAELESEFNNEATHFLATVDSIPAGASRWRKTDKGYKLERFAVLNEFRGYGLGKAMVAAVLDDLPADASYVYLHAQVQAVSLYEMCNFEKDGPMFEEAGIQHYKMVLKKG